MTTTNSSIMNINNMSPMNLKITRVKQIDTQYGPSFICNSSCGTAVFSNKKITEFIQNNPDLLPFNLAIGAKEKFVKGDEEIYFTPVACCA